MFRHSDATRLLDRRADIREIRDLLVQESGATAEIYTDVSAARPRRTVQLLAPVNNNLMLEHVGRPVVEMPRSH